MAKQKKVNIKNEQMATPEQIATIENYIGESLQDFAKKYQDSRQREVFAQNLYRSLKRTENISRESSSQGIYQPIASNDYVNAINYHPLPASSEQLAYWLARPREHADKLRGLSQYLSYSVGVYKNFITYKHGLKAFNYVLTSVDSYINADEKELFKKDVAEAHKLLRKLNLKWQSSRIDLACLYDGVFYGYINKTNESYYLVQLPPQACIITAPWVYGWRFCVDLSYFDKFVGMANCIPELAHAYEVFLQARKDGLQGVELASKQYYPMPVSKSWCFTSDIIHPDTVPEGASAMGAALDNISYRNILKNKLIYELYKIIALKIPMKKNSDQLAITFTEAQQWIAMVKDNLPENVNAYVSPFDSLAINSNQVGDLQAYLNLGSDSFSSSSGIPQAFLGGDDELHQGTALAFVNNVEFNKSTKDLYSQIENFVNFQLDLLPTKYHFHIHMFGNATEKEKEIQLYAGLIGTMNLNPEWALASMGLEPFEVCSTMEMSDILGTKDKMKPMVSAFNTKSTQGASDKGGRPKESLDGLTSEGASIGRDYQANEDV